MMASSCEGRDGSAGSEGGGISAAAGKLGSAGSGGGGIAAPTITSGRVDVGGSGGGGSMARGVEGNVGSAGSGGGGISAAMGKFGSAGSEGRSVTAAGSSREVGGSFGCCNMCERGVLDSGEGSGFTLALGVTCRERVIKRFPVFSAIVSVRRLTSTLSGIGLDAAFGGVGWGIMAGCTSLSAQDAVIQLKARTVSTPNLRMPRGLP
jgi:hypothetical protein